MVLFQQRPRKGRQVTTSARSILEGAPLKLSDQGISDSTSYSDKIIIILTPTLPQPPSNALTVSSTLELTPSCIHAAVAPREEAVSRQGMNQFLLVCLGREGREGQMR